MNWKDVIKNLLFPLILACLLAAFGFLRNYIKDKCFIGSEDIFMAVSLTVSIAVISLIIFLIPYSLLHNHSLSKLRQQLNSKMMYIKELQDTIKAKDDEIASLSGIISKNEDLRNQVLARDFTTEQNNEATRRSGSKNGK